jgi:glycolate dehydrogenase iron-sulfur subunit
MQTRFSAAQLADPQTRASERIVRTCVHCGFCTATCPTYVLLGDELDSPRGRIYLIKEMLENDATPPTAAVVKHIDRCLSCLACMTTCPSGVHYMHLVDHARAHIERTFRRPRAERLLRAILAAVLPRPTLFRLAMLGAALVKPGAFLLGRRWRAMIELVPWSTATPSPVDRPQTFPAAGERRLRVALLTGCVQQVLAPAINEATVRLLTRLGAEVVVAPGLGCCGALVHHLGRAAQAKAQARKVIAACLGEAQRGPLDAIVVNASGCGTMVKDYGFLFADEPLWAARAAQVAALAKDVSEVVAKLGLKDARAPADLVVAYHGACSLQHGQRVTAEPRALIAGAGFRMREVPEGHLCCGSAGTYNLLQPEIAAALRRRKLANIATVAPDLVATGNIGCITQLATSAGFPVLHIAELLDWATGGPLPQALARSGLSGRRAG